MKFKLITLAATLLAAFTVHGAARAGKLEDIKARGYVRIGVSLGGEPIGFRDPQNNPVGYDVDVARMLAAKLGVPVKFSDVSSDARISMLMSGQLDAVVANVSITPERARAVDFSAPYNRAGLRVIVQKDANVTNVAQLSGKRVVVGRGTTAAAFLLKYAPQAKVVYTDNFAPDGVLLLKQRRVEAGIEDSSLLDYLAANNPQLATLPELYAATPIGIAVAKRDPAFLQMVNGFVADYVKSGAYAANYKKWWGPKATPPALEAGR